MSAIKIGDTFRYLDADVVVVAVGGNDDAFPVRDGEVGIRAVTHADGVKLGWSPCTNGEFEAITDFAEFLSTAEPTILTAPTNPSTGAVAAPTPAPVGAPTPEEIRDRVLRDVLNSYAMAHLLTTDAFLNAAKWRFLKAGLTVLAERGLLSAPGVDR